MDNDDITPSAVPGESHVNPAGADGTVAAVSKEGTPSTKEVEAMTLSELNTALGKNFSNRDSALKSIKDTFAYVGKKKEDVRKEVLAEVKTDEKTDKLAKELEEMRKERFYDKNPQYADPSVRKIIERIGGNPAEVVGSEEFKTVFTKVSGYDESQKLKTVLESNPRLASSKDSLTKARELKAKGASQGAAKEEVERLATQAVKDAFGL